MTKDRLGGVRATRPSEPSRRRDHGRARGASRRLPRPQERARARAARGARPRDRHAPERHPRRGSRRRSRRASARSPTRSSTGGCARRCRRHASRRGAAARPPAPDHAGPARGRGRVPRPRLRGARRPRGRDGRVQLRQARVPADALGPLAARHLLLRRRPRPAHRDEPVADPHPRGEAAADLHGLDRPRLPPRRDHRDALPDLPPVRGARRRQGADARRPQGDAAPRDARALRARAARALPDALLPLHRAVDRARRVVRDLRRLGLPHLQVLGLDRDGRRRHGRPAACSRTSASTPRSGAGSRSAAGSSARRSCATTSPTSARCGKATCAC